MPPKVKITKQEILKTALDLVRTNGADSINARAVANALNCSTQPIFSNFEDMDELKSAVIADAYDLYLAFINNEVSSGKYPEYKAFGMAYIRFAMEEKELFKLLFMRDRTGEDLSPSPDFEKSANIIVDAFGVSIETARLIHLEIWACVHGIGVMIATNFLPLELDLISRITSDVYQGIRAKYTAEVMKNGFHQN